MKSKRQAADHSKRRRPAMAGHQSRQRRYPRPIPAQHLPARRQHQHTADADARPDDEITPVEPIKFNSRERPFPQCGKGRFLFSDFSFPFLLLPPFLSS
jgi:hypothetical protein